MVIFLFCSLVLCYYSYINESRKLRKKIKILENHRIAFCDSLEGLSKQTLEDYHKKMKKLFLDQMVKEHDCFDDATLGKTYEWMAKMIGQELKSKQNE